MRASSLSVLLLAALWAVSAPAGAKPAARKPPARPAAREAPAAPAEPAAEPAPRDAAAAPAEPGGASAPRGAPARTAASEEPATPPATKPSEADERAADALERDLEQRWGRTRAVEVVVNRRYPKDLKFEIDVFAATLPNDPFLVYLTPGLRMAFHASEQWAIELGGAYALGFDTGLRRELSEGDALVQARLRDKVMARFGLAVLWSPVYGKIAWANRKVGHIDLYFLAEASGLYAEAVPEMDLKGGLWGGLGLGFGFRFFLSRVVSLRVEMRQRIEIREGLGDETIRLSWPTEISLGVSFLMGRGRKRAAP